MSRRTRRYREKKPWSTNSIVSAIIGTLSIVIHNAVIALTVSIEGQSASIVGGISVLMMIASVIVFIRGLRVCHNDNFDKLGRVLGALMPGIATGLWIFLYLIGIFMG